VQCRLTSLILLAVRLVAVFSITQATEIPRPDYAPCVEQWEIKNDDGLEKVVWGAPYLTITCQVTVFAIVDGEEQPFIYTEDSDDDFMVTGLRKLATVVIEKDIPIERVWFHSHPANAIYLPLSINQGP
jgi:hypothetical protein